MPKRKGAFTKAGENLYRYSSNKTYYAVFRIKGKLVWNLPEFMGLSLR